jgi:pyruvate kinase
VVEHRRGSSLETWEAEIITIDALPDTPEVSDAVIANRAECVMLNKGPFILQAVKLLDDVLLRMQAHQEKKTPRLRALHSWEDLFVAKEGTALFQPAQD